MELNDAAKRLWELHPRFIERAKFDPGSEEDVRFLTLALAGEVGEVANLIKKDWRGDEVDRGHLLEELGDVIAYWLLLLSALQLIPAILLDEAVDKASRAIERLEAQRERYREEMRR
jgi:NTP pyrophosphatase (non-canonical NTP hydrolase)